MRAIFHPLFFLLARCNETRLICVIQALEIQLKHTRKRVPQDRIFLDVDERQEIMDIGQKLGTDFKNVLSIVHYGTYLRWLRNERQGVKPKKMGRPRKSFLIRELILRFAEENAWEYVEFKDKEKAPALFYPDATTQLSTDS